MGWWLSDVWQLSPVFLISWVIWVVGSISLHELGHGWMAIRCGDQSPRWNGRMTLNPLVHIPPMAWLLFALLGMTWGLMPVNPARFRGRYDEAKVAFAGPAVNLLLAAAALVLDVLWLSYATGVQEPYRQNVHTFLWTGVLINSVGFCLNLVPIPPLDGSRILGDFYPAYWRLFQGERGAVVGFVALALLFMVGSGRIWFFAISTAREITEWCLSLTGGVWMPLF